MAKRARGKRRNETSYQYRIRRYKELHPGATTQQARGKPRREHVARREREIEEHGMTLAQQKSVDKFAREQAYRQSTAGRYGGDVDAVIERYREAVREKGFDAFVELRTAVRRLGREKRAQGMRMFQRGTRTLDLNKLNAARDRRLAEMQELAADFFDDDDDSDLLWYN